MNFKTIHGEDDTTTLLIEGELDALTAAQLRETLDNLAAKPPKQLVIDLSGLQLIDSSGVGAIVSLFKRVKAGGAAVRVEGVNGQPRAIFEVLRLDKVFGLG